MEAADYHSIDYISRRLMEATDKMQQMAQQVAEARQIREFDSERRKRALALSVVPFLEQGESATAAEHKARATKLYADNMKTAGRDLVLAEKAIADWTALQARFEALRSLLSVQKSIANLQ